MSMSKEKSYVVVGAVVYIDKLEADKFGYDENYCDHPILVYSTPESKKLFDDVLNNPLLDTPLFGKESGFTINDSYFRVPDHLIQKKFTIEEAREEFPELFL